MCSPVLGLPCCWVRAGHSHWAKLCSSPEAAHSNTESAQLNSEAESFSTSAVTLNQTHCLGSWLRAGGFLAVGLRWWWLMGEVFYLSSSGIAKIWTLRYLVHNRRFSIKTTSFNAEQELSIRSVCRSHDILLRNKQTNKKNTHYDFWHFTDVLASQTGPVNGHMRGHPHGLLQN